MEKGIRISDQCTIQAHAYPTFLKSGKIGKRIDIIYCWYTPLRTCDLCKKVSTPRNISWRSDCFYWNRNGRNDYPPDQSTLCVSCWNKVKPLVKMQAELKGIKKLNAKVYREVLKWQKSQTQGN